MVVFHIQNIRNVIPFRKIIKCFCYSWHSNFLGFQIFSNENTRCLILESIAAGYLNYFVGAPIVY